MKGDELLHDFRENLDFLNPSSFLTYFIPQVSFLDWSLSTPLKTSESIERDEWRKMG